MLFITGNAGSYRQVRPLAAEAAHYFAENLQNDEQARLNGMRDLDFFTADFNEDITAFHGQTLLDQAEYLNEAVAYILSLYHDPHRPRRYPGEPDPTSVIIIGHSMGGIVARTMLRMPKYQSKSINTIITIAAPHARPPVSFDADIVRVYQETNDYWRRSHSQRLASDNPLRQVTLVSIAGGGLDTTVPSDYASLASLVPETHGFTVFTSTIPNVWTGSDHLSILWCDQLRKVIIRAMLDIIDVRQPTQTRSRAERMRAFKKWFLTGMEHGADKNLRRARPTTLLTLEDDSNAILREGERLVVRGLGRSRHSNAYLLPVPPLHIRSEQEFHLLSDQALGATGADRQVDILFCSIYPLLPGQSGAIFSMEMDLSGDTSGSTRLACKDATSDVISLPASTRSSLNAFEAAQPMSYLRYGLRDLTEHQYVAVVDRNSTPRPGWIIAEFVAKSASHLKSPIPLGQLLFERFHTTLPARRSLALDIELPSVHSSLLTYKLHVGDQDCGESEQLFMPLVRQFVSHPFESKYFVNVRRANINLHGNAPFMPPPLQESEDAKGLTLQIWSDPTCDTSVAISLEVDIMGSLSRLVMRYRTVFPAIPLVIIALVLRKQFMIHDREGFFMTFSEALDLTLRTSLPALLSAITVFSLSLTNSGVAVSGGLASSGSVTSVRPVVNATDLAQFTQNERLLGSREPFFWFFIPVFGLLGVGICVWTNYASLLLVRNLALVHRVYRWLFRKSAPENRKTTLVSVTTSSIRRRLTTMLLLISMVATAIPYQFAYLVACFVQLHTCVNALVAREDSVGPPHFHCDDISDWKQTSNVHSNFYNYAHSMLVLMLCVLPINIPVFVVWVHNLAVHWLTPFSSHHNILSIMPFIVLVETLTVGTMIPRLTSR